jgi:hypothetical protein
VDAVTRRVLPLLFLLGCAAGRSPGPAPADSSAAVDSAAAREGVCNRTSVVTVHVDNQSSMDVELSFGLYTAHRASLGFSQTTYRVARSYLTQSIRIRVVRGGLQVGGPATISTEYVVCNDATLIIGSSPRTSFFYGDVLRTPTPRDKRDPGDTTSGGGR